MKMKNEFKIRMTVNLKQTCKTNEISNIPELLPLITLLLEE
jgi:hypothetical protein